MRALDNLTTLQQPHNYLHLHSLHFSNYECIEEIVSECAHPEMEIEKSIINMYSLFNIKGKSAFGSTEKMNEIDKTCEPSLDLRRLMFMISSIIGNGK